MRRRKRRWGIYAASRGTKIFGRLDCPSGRAKIKKENRVFFADWDEAIEFGCRPCKVCRPDIPRVGDVLTLGHPVFGKPYIALWKTSPRPYRNKPQVCFYSALMYTKLVREKHIVVMQQINLEEWLPFPTAAARAVAWGKRLGITVLRPNGMVRDTVLWVPTGRRTAAQGRAYREVTQRRGLTLVTPTIR